MKNSAFNIMAVLAVLFFMQSCSSQSPKAPVQIEENNDEKAVGCANEDPVEKPEADLPEETFKIEAVDLGLSVLWANANLGATDSKDAGDYYAWGETMPKESYTQDNYFDYYIEVKEGGSVYRGFRIFNKVGQSLLKTDYDVAKKVLGGNWRIPTIEECKELISRCQMEYDIEERIVTVTGSNGISMILPCGGFKDYDGLNRQDGYFWTTDLPSVDFDASEAYAAIYGNFSGRHMGLRRMSRECGLNIRPVMDRDAASAVISDGDYDMMGEIGPILARTFELKINGSQVKGILNSYTLFEGTKDKNNTIILKKADGVQPSERIEGVFDGKAFRGTYYHEGESKSWGFKLVMRVN